jgi:carboxylesterase type B
VVTAVTLGCTSGDIAACLRAAPVPSVLASQAHFEGTWDLGVEVGPTLPVVDGVVLDQRPMAAIRAGRGAVPLIAGANRDDTSPLLPVPDAPGAFAQYLAGIGQSANAKRLLAMYPPQALGERGAAIAFSTDVAFACPALVLAQVRPQASRLYELDRPVSSGPLLGYGAVHGLDFIYLFGTFGAWQIEARPERPLSTAMQQLWGAIARGSSPAVWPVLPSILQLDKPSSLTTTWRGGRCPALAALQIVRE